jgi:hypothetical protein
MKLDAVVSNIKTHLCNLNLFFKDICFIRSCFIADKSSLNRHMLEILFEKSVYMYMERKKMSKYSLFKLLHRMSMITIDYYWSFFTHRRKFSSFNIYKPLYDSFTSRCM